MPTNLRVSRPLVRLKPTESCCDLARHFKDGVMREVVGALEHHLHKKYRNDQNFLWVDVPWIALHTVRGSNKKVSMAAREADPSLCHSQRMVEHALLALRELGIISRPMDKEIEGVVQHGFILTPHDALCKRVKTGCLWVGPRLIPGTHWLSEMLFKDGKPTGKKSIQFMGFLKAEVTVPGTVPGTVVGTVVGTVSGTGNAVEAGYGGGYGDKSTKAVEPVEDSQGVTDQQPSISESRAGITHVFHLVQSVQEAREDRPALQTGDDAPLSSFDSLTKTGNDGVNVIEPSNATGSEQVERKPSPQAAIAPETQETNRPSIVETELAPAFEPTVAPATPPVTIAEHFDRVELLAADKLRYLQVATDGLLTLESKNQWGYDANKKAYSDLDNAIREAVKKIGHTLMHGRKSLGEVLDLTIVMQGKLPPAVFKILRQLKESGGDTVLRITKQKRSAPKTESIPDELKARIAAWEAFRERPENKGLPAELISDAFEKEWKKCNT